ncbi:cysteine desulfurase NifS [Anaeropeptidivorans aminofermentans]|uniref:cysteine desulfurase NifS n=1 Tax=Anaeropeptidivorans aminofermentans TaxID=2934315 RepID=UPI002024D5CD|nr:cysteine desulfurase NifS [Anaeropeptidivorans aminofermentans]
MKTNIYFDNAATTKVREEVFNEMRPFLESQYGNPSSIYTIARESKISMEKAREQVAKALGAEPMEIYFTGSGTEADNWAIKSIAESKKPKGNHIITTNIEHHAVLHTCEYLEKNGYEVTYLPVNEEGLVTAEQVKDAIKDETILISIMFANNEIGTIMPIKEIGKIAKEKGILLHTDAVQAVGHVPIDVNALNIDLLTLSAHKLYGPKGVGALYARKGIVLRPFIHGGAQERGRRAGTENVAGIVGLGKAIELMGEEMEEEITRLTALRNRAIDGLTSKIPYCRLNGDRDSRLPGNLNLSFEFIEGESMLLLLDMKGIAASSGSACTSGSLDPSHVLLAIGLPHEKAHGSLRISLGRYNTKEEIEYLIETLPPIVERLREMSPLYEDFLNKDK